MKELTTEALLIEGKSANRVHLAYKIGTDDWKAEYNMLLMDGVTCASCKNCKRCVSMFGANETDTSCQWHPNRFVLKGGKTDE